MVQEVLHSLNSEKVKTKDRTLLKLYKLGVCEMPGKEKLSQKPGFYNS